MDWTPWRFDNIYEAVQHATSGNNILVMKRIKNFIIYQGALIDELEQEIQHLDEIVALVKKRNRDLLYPKTTRSGTKY
jgi:hypothetical protein